MRQNARQSDTNKQIIARPATGSPSVLMEHRYGIWPVLKAKCRQQLSVIQVILREQVPGHVGRCSLNTYTETTVALTILLRGTPLVMGKLSEMTMLILDLTARQKAAAKPLDLHKMII